MLNINKKSVIPKIIHQIWIGPKPRPSKFMDTWKNKHPDYEYIFWNEYEICKRGLELRCISKINDMSEINGKADIIRWEILYKYGGFFMDADSICVEPFDEYITNNIAFAGYEHEQLRPKLVATGTMGFPPNYPLCKEAIEWILNNEISVEKTGMRAWKTVGPGLLTRMLDTGKYKDFTILPSFTFLPIHHTDVTYYGHSKVYAFQEWGSTRETYEIMNNMELPEFLCPPKFWISVLVSSYNTKAIYIKECLNSIKEQIGHFGIELVWINDGSNDMNTRLLEQLIKDFENKTRFTRVVYKKMDINVGIAKCLNIGIQLCTNEIIIKMDSDDIMVPNRITTQIKFIIDNPDCVMCGSNIQFFHTEPNTNEKILDQQTKHPETLLFSDYIKSPSLWFANHPSLCYRKSAVLSVGNYNNTHIGNFEDLELELKLLKKYGKIYNISDILLYYRIHSEQVTFNGKANTEEWKLKKVEMINNIIKEN